MPFIPVKDEDREEYCDSIEHNPPSHIVLNPGMHIWKCPQCGKEQEIFIPDVKC